STASAASVAALVPIKKSRRVQRLTTFTLQWIPQKDWAQKTRNMAWQERARPRAQQCRRAKELQQNQTHDSFASCCARGRAHSDRLFPFNRPRRFACNIKADAIHAFDFVNDPGGKFLK